MFPVLPGRHRVEVISVMAGKRSFPIDVSPGCRYRVEFDMETRRLEVKETME